MKVVILLCLVAVVVCRPESPYSRFSSINVDEITGNDRLIKNLMECLGGSGKCTPEFADLKKIIPDAVNNECQECTDTEKTSSAKVMKAARERLPAEWEQVVGQYVEPSNRPKLDAYVNKYA